VDFIDLNMGCPIDLVRAAACMLSSTGRRRMHAAVRRAVCMAALRGHPCMQICNKGMGAAMLQRPRRMEAVVRAAAGAATGAHVTFKVRTGFTDRASQRNAAAIIGTAGGWGAAAVTVHGRTRSQRYSREADWAYVEQAAAAAPPGLQVIGNGDVFSFEDFDSHLRDSKVRHPASCAAACAASFALFATSSVLCALWLCDCAAGAAGNMHGGARRADQAVDLH
jgi:tRNA-dihydrouridine synthase 3